ncbi:MAG: ABC transporter permease subunit [Rhodospirillales bacterium]|nr:ABC transporter permease subunit [Rhodospirillales bacterium]
MPDWAIVPPETWTVPFIDWINAIVEVLSNEEILGLFTFKDTTRFMAETIEIPLDFAEGVLISGFKRPWKLPPLPWVMIAGLAAVLGWWIGGWRMALLAGGCFVYFAVFGKWKPSMLTFSLVMVAAPVAGLLGIALGLLAYKRQWFERILTPLLNVMQSMPHFSYLIPVAVFIGVSHKAGAIATILFALPPMARLTLLGLKGVLPEVREAGVMGGCTKHQMLLKVEIPAARNAIMVGVNQVIMQCLAMVVIASFIGAKGLGNDLLFRLQSLRIGQALEIGVAIVLMAITLDRLSQTLAQRQPEHAPNGPWWKRHLYICAALGVVAASIGAALITDWAVKWPRSAAVTTAPLWDGIVDYIQVHFFDALEIVRDGLLLHVLIPVRTAFQWMPWPAVVAITGLAGWVLGGWRLAATVSAFIMFIVLAGFWERALITAYMVAVAVVLCVLIGVPIGIWAARSEWRAKAVQFACDTFQTFPSFIYLIPVIMLFRVGDMAAIAAIVIYATIPAVRYTMFGLRNVPSQIEEAGRTSGCNRFQLLWKVRLPLAFPEIMLGVNQTIMFALFMVIIAAFIGTRDLGQEIFRALTFQDAGKGLVIGLCVAFMGLTADRLINAWATKRRAQFDQSA